MGARPLAILLLTGAWFWFCHQWMCCWVNAACCGQSIEQAAIVPPVTDTKKSPLLFGWSDEKPITSEQFGKYKSMILANKSDGQTLEITGNYFSNEENNSKYENMGIARANLVKSLFLDKIPEKDIVLKANNLGAKKAPVEDLFESTTFKWIGGKKMTSSKSEANKEEFKSVVELEDKTLIYFPYNSTSKIEDSDIDDFLTKVARQLKSTDDKVIITGYTDDKGSRGYNKTLGMKRAKAIRKILIKKGVSTHQIETVTMGKKDPIATNETEEGRKKNRRTEVQLIQQN